MTTTTPIRYQYQTHFLIDTKALFYAQRRLALTRQRAVTQRRLADLRQSIRDLLEDCQTASPVFLEQAAVTLERNRDTEIRLLEGIRSLTEKIGD